MKHLIIVILFVAMLPAAAQQQLSIYFDTNADAPDNLQTLKLRYWITQNPNSLVTTIYGYTDYRGTSAYNAALAYRRAQAVTTLLKDNSVLISDSLVVAGRGESTEWYGLWQNRRVVIQYSIPDSIKEVNQEKRYSPKSDFEKEVVVAKVGDKIKVPHLNFYNNSDIVLPQSQPVLKELLRIMKDNPGLKIEIQGHICCQPVEDVKISLFRALAVYNYLVRNGIDKGRLAYTSFGSTRPIYPLPEKNYEQREANRRVEIEVLEN